MAGFSKGFTQEKFASIADGLVVALAVSLPWSTSATSILAVFWLLALIPTLRWADIRREVSALAGGLPVLLVMLASIADGLVVALAAALSGSPYYGRCG